jgi:hypothetical protein
MSTKAAETNALLPSLVQVVPSMSFFDESDPRSLVNILPEVIANRIRDLGRSPFGYLLNLDESALYRELARNNKMPKATDNVLRTKFWMEYDRAQGCGDPLMNVSQIIGRTVSRELFYKHYTTDYLRFSWVLCPPLDYEAAMREALLVGVQKLRHFLDNADFSKDTSLSSRNMQKFLTVFRLLDERLNGFKVLPGKIPTKSDSLPKRKTDRVTIEEVGELEMDSMEVKLKKAKDRLASLKEKVGGTGGTK